MSEVTQSNELFLVGRIIVIIVSVEILLYYHMLRYCRNDCRIVVLKYMLDLLSTCQIKIIIFIMYTHHVVYHVPCIRTSQEKHANLQMHWMCTHRLSLIATIADKI